MAKGLVALGCAVIVGVVAAACADPKPPLVPDPGDPLGAPDAGVVTTPTATEPPTATSVPTAPPPG